MKDEIKAARLAALFGLEAPKPPKPADVARQTNNAREAEAVIAYMTEPAKFTEKTCACCQRIFMVNRSNISCCSDKCRTEHLSTKFGLDVDLSLRTPEERWAPNTGGPEPLVVPPVVAEILSQDQQQTA